MSDLSPEQVEQLKKIGTYLRQQREEMSVPIEEIAAKTLIRTGVLRALEEGQLEQLPEPIFIQGFIRRYGDAIHLDGSALAKTFSPSTPQLKSVKSLPEFSPQPADVAKAIRPYLPRILIGALSVLLIGGVFYLLSRPRTPTPAPRRQNPPVVPTPPPKVVPSPLPTVPTPPKSPQSRVPIQVKISLKSSSWLRVTADEKTQFEGTLAQGIEKSWEAQKQLTLRVGNAGAVMVSLNGEKLKLLGKTGDTKEVTFTPDKSGI